MRAGSEIAGVVNPPPTPSLAGGGLGFVAGEGDFFGDAGQDAVGVGEDVVVPEAEHAVAVGLDLARPVVIGRAVGMLAAVEFDRDPQRAASEVDDVASDGKLARELRRAKLAGAQARPQASFRIRHVPPQLACNAGQSLFSQRRTPIPNPFPQGKGLWST